MDPNNFCTLIDRGRTGSREPSGGPQFHRPIRGVRDTVLTDLG